jgi:hypothetical protein
MVLFKSGDMPPVECGTGVRSRFAALEHMNNARDHLAGCVLLCRSVEDQTLNLKP